MLEEKLGIVTLNVSDYERISLFLQGYKGKRLREIFPEYEVCCKDEKCAAEGGCMPQFCLIFKKIEEYGCCSEDNFLSPTLGQFRASNPQSVRRFCNRVNENAKKKECYDVCSALERVAQNIYLKKGNEQPRSLFSLILYKDRENDNLKNFCNSKEEFLNDFILMIEKVPFACTQDPRAEDGCKNTGKNLNFCCNQCEHCAYIKYRRGMCEITFSAQVKNEAINQRNILNVLGILQEIEEKIKKRSELPYLKEAENPCSSN